MSTATLVREATLKCGANQEIVTLPSTPVSVNQLVEQYSVLLGAGATAGAGERVLLRNGRPVGGNETVEPNDEIEVGMRAGEKG